MVMRCDSSHILLNELMNAFSLAIDWRWSSTRIGYDAIYIYIQISTRQPEISFWNIHWHERDRPAVRASKKGIWISMQIRALSLSQIGDDDMDTGGSGYALCARTYGHGALGSYICCATPLIYILMRKMERNILIFFLRSCALCGRYE